MTALTWTDNLALQQPRMDSTHHEFVDLLNAVAARLDSSRDRLAQALDAFVQHTAAHFAQEEDWMQRMGFAAQNCHSLQHGQVLELVREVQRRLVEEGEVEVVRSLVPALAEWFVVHAQSMDAGLAQSMAACGFDPDTGSLQRALAGADAPVTGCGGSNCG